MKLKTILLLAACGLLVAAAATADSLSVTDVSPMDGNHHLEVFHDNSSAAYVQDNSPADESIYRGSFLLRASDMPTGGAAVGSNVRQSIMLALSPNPNPGGGVCPAGSFVSAFRIFWYAVGGSGQNFAVQMFGRGNQCGEAATQRIALPNNGADDVRVCFEYENGNQQTGRFALAVVDAANPCPTSGDGAWRERNISNGNTAIDMVRLGAPGTNGFGAGEVGTFGFDTFESFRTITP